MHGINIMLAVHSAIDNSASPPSSRANRAVNVKEVPTGLFPGCIGVVGKPDESNVVGSRKVMPGQSEQLELPVPLSEEAVLAVQLVAGCSALMFARCWVGVAAVMAVSSHSVSE